MAIDKKTWWLIIGYLIGSFFGVSQILGLFGGFTNRGQAAAAAAGA